MCCSSSASAPEADPKIGEAAMMEAQTGQDMLQYARDTYADYAKRQDATDALNAKVANAQLDSMNSNNAWAAHLQDRQTNTFEPLQDQYIQEAQNYDTPEKQEAAAAQAKADVMSSAATNNAANARSMASMGINPNSGRWAGTQRSADLSTSVAAAGAMNGARQSVKDKAEAMRVNAINMGNGIAANATAASGTATTAGNSAVGNNQSGNNAFIAGTGIMNTGFNGAMSGYQGQAGALNSQYGTQVQAWGLGQQAQASSSAGMGNLIGTVAGAGIMAF
ncbi:hypothetical protein, partial [Caballeronia zhejiangensis]|uniref:hypothetical protein n=1 Tax=Caballeronia zhejiangensis TaxID=871203 RepID=UPI00054D724D